MKGATARTLGEELIVEYQSIPDHVRDELAATVLASVRSFLPQPGSAKKETAPRPRERSRKQESTVSISASKLSVKERGCLHA